MKQLLLECKERFFLFYFLILSILPICFLIKNSIIKNLTVIQTLVR